MDEGEVKGRQTRKKKKMMKKKQRKKKREAACVSPLASSHIDIAHPRSPSAAAMALSIKIALKLSSKYSHT
ncbi:hypothetical protein TEQG_05103 [Trichophyton equinum CBS 127.97]|uniref:Uncharacterized protein n=1 Tax=Trichophyton equinum (strain ATCC MYA-4606 / CBS 127.97) TaxID=559882 RepID=F2PWD9_TRIEC|nr:hypothetical protein TEQG_05103 [Trichophyton equinum CBS 127.97]